MTVICKKLLENGLMGNEGSAGRDRNRDNPSAFGRVHSSSGCDAVQHAHTVPTGVGMKNSDLLIPMKQGNALNLP